jgi:hypothetical protein
MALPTNSSTKVDCTITQAVPGGKPIVYTWTSYTFGQFSDWVQIFNAGTGVAKISCDGKTLVSKTVELTPGPLVVALLADPGTTDPTKYWPPTGPTNIGELTQLTLVLFAELVYTESYSYPNMKCALCMRVRLFDRVFPSSNWCARPTIQRRLQHHTRDRRWGPPWCG